MKFRLMLMNILIFKVSAHVDNDFIFDYFKYKQVSKFVGFSCNSYKGI